MRDIARAEPALVLLPLRAFLGVTFCFAGLQKLANPNFFRAASPISIQAQLVAAERSSPLGHSLHPLMQVSTLLGVVIALGELAVGLGVLTGVLIRVAAAGGMVISFMLFLTVTFHSRPFYTGADIVYFFALTPFLLAGSGTLTLPALLDRLAPPASRHRRPRPGMAGLADRIPVDQGRRDALAAGALAGAGLVLAALDVGLGRLAGGTRPPAAPVQLGSGPTPATTTPQEGPASTTAPSEGPATTSAPPGGGVPGGTKVGPAANVPVGGSASFRDPSSGDPAIVIQARAGDFAAFDAVCPHAGCTVGYSRGQNVIVCPCHGSRFNAATGAVEQGPAASNLRTIKISEGRDGNLYVT
jgi:thiosulfate dehydrogenase [quinone] large subunit